jgi:DNA-binding Lrp family transcriptional regulator
MLGEKMTGTSSKRKSQEVNHPRISRVDKEILKVLLDPDNRISTQDLAKKIGVPLSTVQRRRKQLERKYLEIDYSLKLKDLGIRRIDFYLHITGGNISQVGLDLLKNSAIVFVSSAVGESSIDVRAEAVIRDNAQLGALLEALKGTPNVKDVMWSEVVEVIGKKKSIPSDLIDSL